MLVAASHIRAPPYLAVTVGPRSHSPPPIAEALSTTPGPIMARIFRQPTRGVSISSPVFQRGMAWEPGCGARNVVSFCDGVSSAGASTCVIGQSDGGREKRGERESG